MRRARDGLEEGRLEVIADRDTEETKAALHLDPAEVYGFTRTG